MLGKTHVVVSLAAAHAGVLAYLNARKEPDTAPDVTGLFAPLDLVTYGVVGITLLLFVLLILRIGNTQLFMTYTVTTALLLFLLYSLEGLSGGFPVAMALLAFGFGSLLPDIDSEESTLGRYVPFISRVIPHRTITHTIWAVIALVCLAWYADSVYLYALALGYAVHIAEDSFSKQGICWFYPVLGKYDTFGSGAVKKRGRKTTFAYKTGGTGETAAFYGAVGVHVLCLGAAVWLGFGIQ